MKQVKLMSLYLARIGEEKEHFRERWKVRKLRF